jgi:hypothetical protein
MLVNGPNLSLYANFPAAPPWKIIVARIAETQNTYIVLWETCRATTRKDDIKTDISEIRVCSDDGSWVSLVTSSGHWY